MRGSVLGVQDQPTHSDVANVIEILQHNALYDESLPVHERQSINCAGPCNRDGFHIRKEWPCKSYVLEIVKSLIHDFSL
jgi:hypothetical protein